MRISRKAGIGLLGAAPSWPGVASPSAPRATTTTGDAGRQDRPEPPEERHPVRRRRHGRLRGDARPLLRQGGRRAAQHGPAAVPGQLDPLRAAPRSGSELPPELRRRLRAHGDRLVDRQAHAGRPPLPGPERRRQRPRLQSGLSHLHGDRARAAARPRATSRPRRSRTPPRRARARTSRSAHARARPTRGRPARRRPRRPAAWARSPSSRSTRTSTSTSAADAPATRRRSPRAAPTR